MPALLSMTASICGPKTKVEGQGKAFNTTLNSYLIAVCDPGGGKTVTYDTVIEPVMDEILTKFGKKMQLDNYTNPGIQKHQISNDGYGLITSDEGHRFLSSINCKQMKGESERSIICKMWNGKGDFTQLSSVSRPALYPTSTVKVNYLTLQNSKLQNFVPVFLKMFEHHTNGVTYKLSTLAQEEYDKMTDSFAEVLDEKYKENDENNEDDKENIPSTQIDLCMTSNKDTLHVLRPLHYYIFCQSTSFLQLKDEENGTK
ncbi:unnamed protein product [Mytilus coruscus]|uniref:Uncharacterized protein n=1 Tax=Mytilus coruscus TaxID=42192 RepID=A0A6J8DR98_MYTCO|nr:unnamed protein product [Mytilus coruscus]